MPFEFVEDAVTSDVTFRAWGGSLDAIFGAAIDATAATMVADLDTIRPQVRRVVEVDGHALDLLLLRVLEEAIFLKDTERLLLRAAEVRIEPDTRPLRAYATLVGEPIDRTRHALVADVKAVTLHGLSVERRADGWHASVTLDV